MEGNALDQPPQDHRRGVDAVKAAEAEEDHFLMNSTELFPLRGLCYRDCWWLINIVGCHWIHHSCGHDAVPISVGFSNRRSMPLVPCVLALSLLVVGQLRATPQNGVPAGLRW